MSQLNVKWARNALASFASSDPTRWVLQSVYVDKEHWVSTDDHRIFAVARKAMVGGTLGETKAPPFDARLYPPALRSGVAAAVVEDAKYPEWQRVLPKDKPVAVFDMELPDWVSALAGKRGGRRFFASIAGGDKPHLRMGAQEFTGRLTSIDLRLLAPMAGMRVGVAVFSDTDPVVICDSPKLVRKPLEAPWFAAVMPVRTSEFTAGADARIWAAKEDAA